MEMTVKKSNRYGGVKRVPGSPIEVRRPRDQRLLEALGWAKPAGDDAPSTMPTRAAKRAAHAAKRADPQAAGATPRRAAAPQPAPARKTVPSSLQRARTPVRAATPEANPADPSPTTVPAPGTPTPAAPGSLPPETPKDPNPAEPSQPTVPPPAPTKDETAADDAAPAAARDDKSQPAGRPGTYARRDMRAGDAGK
jgi:hypothetical protein